jgi:oligopeptide/dipeptide ABC transporter ATP-binding protein
MDRELLVVKNLNTYCPSTLGSSRIKILDMVTLVVHQNEIVGLVGETGAGKSVLIDSIGCNLQPPLWCEAEELSINLNGKVEDLLEKSEDELRDIWGKGIAFIPSNARDRLNPIMPIGQQISNIIQARFLLSRQEAYTKVIEMFEMVHMPDPKQNFSSYPHELSGGMSQRAVISIALSMSPILLLADEPTMGLDVTIQAQILDLIADLVQKVQSSVILATRDLGIVANYCNKVAVMCNGQLVEFSEVRDFFKNAIQPYSNYLLKAAFASQHKAGQIELGGAAATKEQMEMRKENSCHFVTRCPIAQEMCWSVTPPVKFIDSTHYVRCHKWEGK